ncbi:MAG: hypothetical protein ACI8W9_000981 [Psychromonas sp.]
MNGLLKKDVFEGHVSEIKVILDASVQWYFLSVQTVANIELLGGHKKACMAGLINSN